MGLALLCVGEESHRGAGLAPECRSKRLIADWPKADRVGWRTCGQGATACRSTSGGLDNHRTPGINPGGSPCGLLDGSDDPVAVKTTGFKSRCTARLRPTARSATVTSYRHTYFYLLPRGGKARCLSGTSPRRCVVSVGCCVLVYMCVLCIVGPRNQKCGAPPG